MSPLIELVIPGSSRSASPARVMPRSASAWTGSATEIVLARWSDAAGAVEVDPIVPSPFAAALRCSARATAACSPSTSASSEDSAGW